MCVCVKLHYMRWEAEQRIYDFNSKEDGRINLYLWGRKGGVGQDRIKTQDLPRVEKLANTKPFTIESHAYREGDRSEPKTSSKLRDCKGNHLALSRSKNHKLALPWIYHSNSHHSVVQKTQAVNFVLQCDARLADTLSAWQK